LAALGEVDHPAKNLHRMASHPLLTHFFEAMKKKLSQFMVADTPNLFGKNKESCRMPWFIPPGQSFRYIATSA